MSADLQKQILITKSALAMLTDIHDFKNRVSFPHSNRTGLAEAQLFGLLASLDATVPYYIKTCTPTTTQENGDWNWTFLVDYTSTDAAEIAGRAQTAEQSAAFLARQLFHASMPDYVRLYRACAFLAASVHYENDTAAHPNCNNAYGALIGGAASCQGFSQTLKLLLDMAGVPCQIISGPVLREKGTPASDRYYYDVRTKSTRHYWNLVGIETSAGVRWFHVDVCWDQTEEGTIGFQYFLKDDAFMLRSRTWNRECFSVCNVLPGSNIERMLRGF